MLRRLAGVVHFSLIFNLVFAPLGSRGQQAHAVLGSSIGDSPATHSHSQLEAHPRVSGKASSSRSVLNAAEDFSLLYWAMLDYQNPGLVQTFLSLPDPQFPQVPESLLDDDPFFMRSQAWESQPDLACTSDSFCFSRTSGSVLLVFGDQKLGWRLNQNFTVLAETQDYVLFQSIDGALFDSKWPDELQFNQGLFFIRKDEWKESSRSRRPVPVFFFPLPGNGWTGVKPISIVEDVLVQQLHLRDQQGDVLSIDLEDVALLEHLQRNNLLLAQTAEILETGKLPSPFPPLPASHFTMGFGLVCSGKLPHQIRFAYRSDPFLQQKSNINIFNLLLSKFIVPAWGDDDKLNDQSLLGKSNVTRWKKLVAHWENWRRQWAVPTVLYGSFGALAAAIYEPEFVKNLIPQNFATVVQTVGMIMAGVVTMSITLKYTIHREYFQKKYPKQGLGFYGQIKQEFKGIFHELAHGFYFSYAFLPQTVRFVLELVKDRLFPMNRMVHKLWDLTFRYQMRHASQIPMNHRTLFLGWMHGAFYSTLLALTLFVFAPWLAYHYGLGVAGGATAAAFASSEVLRNFLSYLQSGAFVYSSHVKGLHMLPAQREAERRMISMGKNPDAVENKPLLEELTQEELQKIFRLLKLPDSSDFLYDPTSFFEWIVKIQGYSADYLTGAIPQQLQNKKFALKAQGWGLIPSALDHAIEIARKIQEKENTEVGRQTLQLLRWAKENRGIPSHIAGRVWDVLSSDWASKELRQQILKSVESAKSSGKLGLWDGLKAVLSFFLSEGSREVRDINYVLFLGSQVGGVEELGNIDIASLLPESWLKKAGSLDAAMAGMRLFHFTFMSLLSRQYFLLSGELEAPYRERARRLLERKAGDNNTWSRDRFLNHLQILQVGMRLKERDQERRAIFQFRPPQMDFLEERQWKKVRDWAYQYWSASRQEEPGAHDEIWDEIFQVTQNELANDPKVQNTIANKKRQWIRDTQFKFFVAQQMAQANNLLIEDPEQSEFVRKALVKAILNTIAEVNTKRSRMYLSRLNQWDRAFEESRMFYKHFVASYLDETVRNEEASALNSEYPGYFQKVRKAVLRYKYGSGVARALKFFETFFRNENESYFPGLLGWLNRNIPFIPDLIYNMNKHYRNFPYFISFGFLINYYVWQIHKPYALVFATALLIFVFPTLVEWNNRFLRNFDIQPMKSVGNQSIHSFTYHGITSVEPVVLQNHADQIQGVFNKLIAKPVEKAMIECARVFGFLEK
ncbi:MAG: hypothetical protein NZ480_00550 [Bdellovibrionaceae bacterium]|nr:hypothetical protein [Pseudobdellovibrionaceae bacterium]MDW8190430.1 hypothetical protein [Pseudobdellovibrionaceae bacterium]